VETVGIFRQGQFFLRNSNTPGFADVPVVVIAGTQPGDLPLAGDWDSDGRDTPGVFRATAQSAQFFLSSANASGMLRGRCRCQSTTGWSVTARWLVSGGRGNVAWWLDILPGLKAEACRATGQAGSS
jgi:hypothetical protein